MSKERDAILTATIGAKKVFRKEVVEFNGVKVEIRQPSNKSRRELLKRVRDKDGTIDPLEFLVWSVIENTYVPDTEEKVFEPGHYDALMEQPVGGFLDKFGEVAAEVFTPKE